MCRRAAAAAAVLVMAVLAACAPPAAGPRSAEVIFYGDSILSSVVTQVSDQVGAVAPTYRTVDRTQWGTAPCDSWGQMNSDTGRRPAVVVIEYVGNMATYCTVGRTAADVYGNGLTRAVDLWQRYGTKVVLVVAPAPTGTLPADHTAGNAARLVAASRHTELVDVASSYLDPATGRYAQVVPCTSADVGCTDPGAVVRSPDGWHLCDHAALNSLVCPVTDGTRRLVDPLVAALSPLVTVPAAA